MKKVIYTSQAKDTWDQFCSEHPKGWFWHTSHWLEYCLEARFGVETRNLSYLLLDEKTNTILAVVPIILEIDGLKREFTFSGGAIPEALIQDAHYKELEQYIYDEYRRLAAEHGAGRLVIRQSNRYQAQINTEELLLIRRGFIDVSLYTSIIDLRLSGDALLAKMTKGHRSAIAKASKASIQINRYDSAGLTGGKWLQFQEAYFRAAGKKTRPEKTFELLEDFVRRGYGYLFEAVEQNSVTGFVYIFVYKKYAYYAMSCRDNISGTVSASQAMQWAIIKFLKSADVHFYELGEQYFTPTFFYPVDHKMLAISQHKRGFGGEFVVQPVGEYYFLRSHFSRLWQERMEKYMNVAEFCEEQNDADNLLKE